MNEPSTVSAVSARFVIGSPLRIAGGLALVVINAALLWYSRTIDWGVGWMVWIPVLLLFFPAAAMMRRVVLEWSADGLSFQHGVLWRRAYRLGIDNAALEVVTMAGFEGVIWHNGPRHWPLALWLAPSTSKALQEWLDAHHEEEAWPRVHSERAEWDR